MMLMPLDLKERIILSSIRFLLTIAGIFVSGFIVFLMISFGIPFLITSRLT